MVFSLIVKAVELYNCQTVVNRCYEVRVNSFLMSVAITLLVLKHTCLSIATRLNCAMNHVFLFSSAIWFEISSLAAVSFSKTTHIKLCK